MAKEIYPPMSERELCNAALARRAAAESMVLLKNDNQALPLTGERRIALFGSGAVRTVRGGTGSGDPFNGGLSGGGDEDVDASPRYHIYILDAFLAAGWDVLTAAELADYAAAYDEARHRANVTVMSTFAYPEQQICPEAAARHAACTDTAVYVISRNSGEGHDRSLLDQEKDIGDYLLSECEKQNLRTLRGAFRRVVLVLNVGGVIDLSLPVELGVDAILLMGQAGQEGGMALFDVLTGRVNPSGRLTDSWAWRYSDYPASATFAMNDGDSQVERYIEGIYVGYRYFDSFGIEPIYPFGFGLSYTTFSITPAEASLCGEELSLSAVVTNTGAAAGREVVQAYASAPGGRLEMPVQELCGFAKTGLLAPGNSETVHIRLSVRSLASYDAARECYVLQAGDYVLRVGSSSRCTRPACVLRVCADTVTRRAAAVLPLQQPLDEISRASAAAYVPDEGGDVPAFTLGALDAEPMPVDSGRVTTYTTDPDYRPVMPYETVELVQSGPVRFEDVLAGRAEWKELAAQLSNAELALLNCGTGWGVSGENEPIVGANSKTVRGAAGETTLALTERYGIPSIIVADGPGGIRVTQHYEARNVDTGEMVPVYRYCTAWPVGTLLAQSFDLPLLHEIGRAFGVELKEMGVHILLAPGMNIHRDPLCGRNFEYYSEDPLLSGKCAAAITLGVQSIPGVGTCIKHFAANNQETSRNSSDSQIGPRALREIYLRGFEIAVRESQPMAIMTAYNQVCSVPAGDSYALCTQLARNEWGFQGLIMTDWNGGSSTAWKSMHAGNDLIMPGGVNKSDAILLAAEPIAPAFDERGQVVRVLSGPFPIPELRWNAFTVAAGGPDTVSAPIAPGHSAQVDADGRILVDGRPVYTAAMSLRELMQRRSDGSPAEDTGFMSVPATTEFARLSEDGRAIVYQGHMRRTPLICRGDLQRCAIHNLQVIARCQA